MGAIKLGLGPLAVTRQAPAWMSPFQLALDFRAGRYQLNRQQVGLSRIDSLYHSRASARRAEDGRGVSREVGNGVMAVTDRGYDAREGWTNLVGSADFATATVGVLGAGGTLPGWVATAVPTAGLTTEVVELLTYRGLPAARVRVYGPWNGTFWELRPGEQQGLTEGVTYTSSMVIAERQCPGAAAPQLEVSWRSAPSSAFVSAATISTPAQYIDTATPDLRFASLVCPVGASRIRLRLTSGGAAGWVAGNVIDFTFIVAAPQVTATPYLMPFGSNTVASDVLVVPAADAGLAINPTSTGLTMVWRGRDFQSANAFSRFIEARADSNNRFTLFRRLSGGGLGSTLGSGGPTSGPDLATLTQVPRDAEFTAVATWRADGTFWGRAGAQSPVTISGRPMLIGSLTGIGLSCGGDSGAILNAQTRLAAVGAFSLSDADALALFSRVAS
jgi:hypothetical protein